MVAAAVPITAKTTRYINPRKYESVEAINEPMMMGAIEAARLEHIFMKPPPVATTLANAAPRPRSLDLGCCLPAWTHRRLPSALRVVLVFLRAGLKVRKQRTR